jgi:hypothetical protein
MRFRDIESLLGEETVAQFESLVASALSAPRGGDDKVCALRELLVAMLAAIVTTKAYLPQSERLATADATRLQDLVAAILRIHGGRPATRTTKPAQSGTMVLRPANDDGAALLSAGRGTFMQHQHRALSLTTRQHAEGMSRADTACKKFDSSLLSRSNELSAQRIARLEAMRAQANEFVRRSQVLRSAARTLTTSLQQTRQLTRSRTQLAE